VIQDPITTQFITQFIYNKMKFYDTQLRNEAFIVLLLWWRLPRRQSAWWSYQVIAFSGGLHLRTDVERRSNLSSLTRFLILGTTGISLLFGWRHIGSHSRRLNSKQSMHLIISLIKYNRKKQRSPSTQYYLFPVKMRPSTQYHLFPVKMRSSINLIL